MRYIIFILATLFLTGTVYAGGGTIIDPNTGEAYPYHEHDYGRRSHGHIFTPDGPYHYNYDREYGQGLIMQPNGNMSPMTVDPGGNMMIHD